MRIVIADDHPLVRSGIRTALFSQDGLLVVAEASTGDEALRAVLEAPAGPADFRRQHASVAPPDQVISRARETFPELKTLILTAHDDDVFVRK